MSKILINLPLTLILLGLCFTQDNSRYEGCMYFEGGICVQCYRSLPQGPGNGKGGCEAPPKADPNCSVFTYDLKSGKTFCTSCEPGFVINESRLGLKNSCAVKNTIKGCLSTGKFVQSKQMCYICADGLYASLTNPSQCVSAGKDAIEHCLWGGQYSPKFGAACRRCKGAFAIGNDRRHCVPQTAPGCLINRDPKT